MPKLSLLPPVLRELVGARTLPREPEPDLVMGADDQVAAYAIAGRHPSGMSAAGLFHAAHVSAVLQGCQTAVDLGCGPCTQLAQIAELNPDISFTGVDLSSTMLDSARSYLGERKVSNVALVQDDISRLETIPERSADAVVSTVALHHLPTLEALRSCFKQVRRILKPGGAIYIADLTRLKSVKSVVSLAYADRGHQPHLFLLDYERSLRAAFLLDEFKLLAKEELPGDVQVFSTFLLPLFAVVKTPDRALRDDQHRRLRAMRADLPKRYRADLDELRRFFRMGGLENDPFR
jgi:SAM-dependent methyltransferase